jgi:hypothetical protein
MQQQPEGSQQPMPQQPMPQHLSESDLAHLSQLE